MRIAYVAGFFKQVLPELQNRFKKQLENGAVVWIPPYRRTDELNVNRFKGAFLDAVNRGATEVLICLFIMRGKDNLADILEAIIEEGKSRLPELDVRIERFQSARDGEGVISEIEQFDPNVDRPAPSALDSLEEWVLERHNRKVVLHSRAVNAAKKSQYGDIELIYAAIDFLGVEYWDLRTAQPEQSSERKERLTAKLQALGLELAPSISPSRAGEHGDEYFVFYPPGTTRKRLLESHLKKGSDREERFCLRLYFFWDDEERRVVIGWLPGHLDTRAT